VTQPELGRGSGPTLPQRWGLAPIGAGAHDRHAPGVRDDTSSRHGRLAVQLGERRLRRANRSYVSRIGFAVAGFVVSAAGVAMLVLPGPGVLVTALGLGMLAPEFHWAERLLLRGAELGGAGRARLVRRRSFARRGESS
jgi:hypothetical protein